MEGWANINITACKVIAIPKSMFGFTFGGFEALFEILVIDLAVMLLILCLFSLLTKISRNVNLTEVADLRKMNWIQMFYGDANATTDTCSEDEAAMTLNLGNPKGYMFWLFAMMHLSDEHILHRSGLDSVQYLTFQKYIILLAVIISVFSILVILPINYLGEIEPTRKPFARTTLRNVNPKSFVAWVHPVACYLYFLIGFLLLKKFYKTSVKKEKLSDVNNTLLIRNISLHHRETSFLKEYFISAYSDVIVEEVQLGYDIKKLARLNKQRVLLDSAIEWCKETITETGKRPLLKLKPCGYMWDICSNCCNYSQADALDYYTDRRFALLDEMVKERDDVLKKPLDIAFVTFQTHQMANMVLKKEFEISSDDPNVFAKKWNLSYSPSARNILWENLGTTKKNWYLRWLLVNASLFVIIVFFSTPNVVMNLSGVLKLYEELQISNPFMSQYLPTLILILLSSCLPVLVASLVSLLPYFTRSEYSSSVNVKLFVYLLLMVVVMPITEFTSVDAIIRRAINKEGNFQWECIFIPDNGMFFSSYLIQSGIIGVVMQLIRLPELTLYFLFLLFSRSKAETVAVRKAAMREFDFGYEYAYYLLQTSIIIIFSVATPVVAPLGLFYLISKHFVDSYNIYFVYAPVKMSKDVHEKAIILVTFSFFVLMLFMGAIAFVRNGFDGIFVLYFFGALLTLSVWLEKMYKPTFLKYVTKTKPWLDEEESGSNLVESVYSHEEFLPGVLKITYT